MSVAGKTGQPVARLFGAGLLLVVVAAAPARAQSEPEPAPGHATDPLELVVVVHQQNRAVLSGAEIENIFLLKRRQWADGTPIIPFNLTAGIGPRRLFDMTVLRMTPDEVARYWLDQRIRAGTRAPRQLGDATLALRLAARVRGAIAYVPASSLNDHSVRVVARIRAGKILPP